MRVDAPGYGSVETVLDLGDGRRQRIDLRLRRGANLDDEDAELLHRLPPVLYTDPGDLPGDAATRLHVDARRPEGEVPLPGVRVRFFEGDAEMAPPMDFTELEFDLIGLPEATYRVSLAHPLLNKTIILDRFRLRRDEPVTLTLR